MLPNKSKILNSLINKKEEPLILIGTVTAISPLTVKFPPDTTNVNVVACKNLFGLSVGNRVTILRFKKQFIVVGIIGSYISPIVYKQKTSNTIINNDSSVNSDTQMTLSLPSNGFYKIDAYYHVDASTNTPDFKLKYSYSNITLETYRYSIGAGINATSVYNSPYMTCNSHDLDYELRYGVTGSGWSNIHETFNVSTSSSDGSITPQYSQDVATSEDTIVVASSYIMYTKLDSLGDV